MAMPNAAAIRAFFVGVGVTEMGADSDQQGPGLLGVLGLQDVP